MLRAYCLFTTTDQAILMIQSRVTDLWRLAKEGVPYTVNWAVLYKKLVTDLAALPAQGALADGQLRLRVVELVQLSQQAKPPSWASRVRERLFEEIRPVRPLLAEIGKLPSQGDEDHPVLTALNQLPKLYSDKARELPFEVSAPRLGSVWSAAITGEDRDKAMRALEVATLFSLRRAVRNGSVWVDHSLVFRGRACLFFTTERLAAESKRHYARLDLPTKASAFLAPLLTRIRAGVAAVAKAAREGVLRVDDELHLSPIFLTAE